MKKNGSMKGAGQGAEKHRHENVEHAFLRVDRTDFDDLLAVLVRRLDHLIESDVGADELHRPVGTGRYGLGAGAGKPEDRCAAATRPSRKGGCSKESLSRFSIKPPVSSMTIEKTMVVAPTTAVPINTGLAVALKVLPAPSFSSSRNFAERKVEIEAEIPLDFRLRCRESARSSTAHRPIARCR
jgi:hypothetical protein